MTLFIAHTTLAVVYDFNALGNYIDKGYIHADN